jgi:hypothetical protein
MKTTNPEKLLSLKEKEGGVYAAQDKGRVY